MTITTKYAPGELAWPIVFTSGGYWLSASHLLLTEVIVRSAVIVFYRFEGNFTVDATCVFSSKESADGECLRRNAAGGKS